jgi:hypothetical protein
MNLPIEELKRFCKRENIEYLAVFGSFAEGRARPDSDVDLVISFVDDNNVGLLHFLNIKHKLEDLLGRRVDLVTQRGLNPKIKKRVQSSLKKIYGHAA